MLRTAPQPPKFAEDEERVLLYLSDPRREGRPPPRNSVKRMHDKGSVDESLESLTPAGTKEAAALRALGPWMA